MSKIIGIDLGTTFSAVAQLDETGRPTIVHNRDGANITPSVVSITGPGRSEVGEEARKVLFFDQSTFGRFKREMGTEKTYNSPAGVFTPTQLSALVLKKLREDAEAVIGPVAEAVVTIPANFANEAREATMAAARDAGLSVKYIINEPTAAALYFAFQKRQDLGGNYAVYDLGGGTFDITIVQISGNDVKVLSTAGVSQLGGDDFDQRLVELVGKKYHQAMGAELGPKDYTRTSAEEDKKSLSRREQILARVSGPGGRANISIERKEFEEAISALLSQTEMLCEQALEDADVKTSEIREVILAGGSTRIPAVQRSVARVFGREPSTFANPDEVVALGAALYAAYKTDPKNLNPIQRGAVAAINIAEITSKCFGTITLRQSSVQGKPTLVNSTIIRKGTAIPASKTESFYTVSDDQRSVDCTVTESAQEEVDPEFVRVIWQGELALPGGRPANQEIQVTFSYDANQTMRCSFRDVGTNVVQEVKLTDLGGRSGRHDGSVGSFVVE